jgi:hypothetical protein
MAPEHVAAFTDEFKSKWNRQLALLNDDHGAHQRELAQAECKLHTLINASANGVRASGKIQKKLDVLEG